MFPVLSQRITMPEVHAENIYLLLKMCKSDFGNSVYHLAYIAVKRLQALRYSLIPWNLERAQDLLQTRNMLKVLAFLFTGC